MVPLWFSSSRKGVPRGARGGPRSSEEECRVNLRTILHKERGKWEVGHVPKLAIEPTSHALPNPSIGRRFSPDMHEQNSSNMEQSVQGYAALRQRGAR